MNKSNLITVKPKIRSKGFKNENISISEINKTDFEFAFNQIEEIYKNSLANAEDNKETQIINKIYNSYLKFNENQKLKEDDMILKKHENMELRNIEKLKMKRYFIYRYKFNIHPKLKIIDNFPPCVQIEPTSICNYRCVMCYQADKSFSNKSNGFMGHMEFDTFKKCIDELEGNIEAITFASRGEPTLNNNFEKMLKYCEGKFLALKLNTNASMLNIPLLAKGKFSEGYASKYSPSE